jgi:hypothetical protein
VLDLDALRSLPGRRPMALAGLDAGGRLFVGPWASALDGGATAELTISCDDALRIALHVAAAPQEPWRALLAAGGPRTIPRPPADALAVLALDRSLRTFYQRLADLLAADDVVAAQAALAVLDQVDGRTSFVDDLLGGLQEPLTAYLLPTPRPEDGPRLLLPGLAVTAAMTDPGVERILQRTFQLLLLIANGERAQRQLKPFVATAVRGEVHGLCAELLPWRGPGDPPLEHGLSPTLLFGHGHAVLASTRAAAEQLMQVIASGAAATVDGDLLELRGPAIAAAIAANRAPLELARMLDEGEDEVAARRFFDVLLAVTQSLHSLRVTARQDGGQVELALEVRGVR